MNRNGRVCHALLGREYDQSMTLATLLPAVLSSLLAAPSPEDPLNKEAAALFYADERTGGTRYELAVRTAVAEHAFRPPSALEVDIARGSGQRLGIRGSSSQGSIPRPLPLPVPPPIGKLPPG